MTAIERAYHEATDAYRAGVGLPPLRARYLRAPCGSLIRDCGADDLQKHIADCRACKEGWNVFDKSKSEDERLDDPRHDQCRNGKFVE